MYLAQKFWDLEDLDVTVIETHTAQLEKFDPNDLWTRHIRPLRAHVEYADGFAATKGGRRELPSTVEQAERSASRTGRMCGGRCTRKARAPSPPERCQRALGGVSFTVAKCSTSWTTR